MQAEVSLGRARISKIASPQLDRIKLMTAKLEKDIRFLKLYAVLVSMACAQLWRKADDYLEYFVF